MKHKRIHAPNKWGEMKDRHQRIRYKIENGKKLTADEFMALTPRERWILVAERLGLLEADK